MTQKIKVIEVNATQLDPNANYLIIFNEHSIDMENARFTMNKLKELGVTNTIGLVSNGPPDQAVKVFEIPKEKKE